MPTVSVKDTMIIFLVRLKTALKLKDTQMPMMNHPVGYFK